MGKIIQHFNEYGLCYVSGVFIFFMFFIIFTMILYIRTHNNFVLKKDKYLYSKIKQVVIKSEDDAEIDFGVMYSKLKIIKILKVKDKFSPDGREQYYLIVKPIK